MTQTVSMPLWVFILILLFAAVTFASHFLFPSVRWFFRKRAERVIERLNSRLQRPIEPFKLARRYDMIQRLIYDPDVTEAIVEHARKEGIPENVAFEQAKRYAREIVPSFSATAYFTVGARLAKWLSKAFYRVRLGQFDRKALEKIDPDATVIFVINHRSNMDYVLVTYLVSRAGALSYAVGEWARVWPLSGIIRAMGAYFIRRRSRGALYRKVLARYVQMATDGGVTQAMFPEGGLSLTGRLGEPKLGLLNYIVSDRKSDARDVIFVPVGLNYDRIFEDKFLVRADQTGVRKFRPPLGKIIGGTLSHIWLRITGRFKGFGTASVGFGTPLELSSLAPDRPDLTEAIGAELMKRIAAVVPILAGPLVSHVLLSGPPRTTSALVQEVDAILQSLKDRKMPTPRRKAQELVTQMTARLERRGLVSESDGTVTVTEEGRPILQYYANTIAHHFETDPT
ncbi:1-acyl-sn-glycerol-3-phosphate acyltransferase [Yoonia sp. 208BN28-4]|uniref:1-acyl-sn-glycerol-3-phosphate acyltransferase n=1 Tax=Yoonia sp. 208BN28-4 TaxID=3126505 RepID=UPI0030A3A76A